MTVPDPGKEASDRVVITEQDYFDFFHDPLSIFNYTLLHLLREHCCVFVGLSMIDDNLRRLLHCSKQERVKSLKQEGIDDREELRNKAKRHFAILRQVEEPLNSAVKDTLGPLGVEVLTIRDFAEIPKRLQTMYDLKHGEGQWEKVYDGVS